MKISLVIWNPQLWTTGCSLVQVLLLTNSVRASSNHAPFILPPPPYPNVTHLDRGYNPWMTKYSAAGLDDPEKPTIIMITGGCLPLDDGGSDFYQDAGTGFRKRCEELGVQYQCRPAIYPTKFNPPQPDRPPDYPYQHPIFGEHSECVWEIFRALEEHRKGLMKLAGISVKCSYEGPYVFDIARELGVPIFLMGVNKPYPHEMEYKLSQPTGFIGTDQEFLGRTLARQLKQLHPSGGTYAFIMNWISSGQARRRLGFVKEISKDNKRDGRPHWFEIPEYPFNTNWDTYQSWDCDYMTCQMEKLANPVYGINPSAIIFLYQTPIRNKNYTVWVDAYRNQNISLIAMDALDYLEYLGKGYVDGLVGQVTYEMGVRSAEVLAEIASKGIGGPHGVQIPLDNHLFETRLVAYNKIPLDLDKLYPLNFDQNLLGNISVLGLVCVCIVYVSALACLLWAVYHRSAMVVRAAQPFFLLVLLAGVIILASAIIPLSFDDDGDPSSMSETFAVGVCMSVPWLAFTGLSIIFATLFSKTWRVTKIFQSAESVVRIQLSKQDVLAPFTFIFTCNMIVLACWQVIDPLTYERMVGSGTDFWNREIESYGACRSDKALAFLAPLALINFSVIAVACWQAFESRKIESEFAESKYIMLSVASLFQAFLTGIPIAVMVRDDPQAYYLVMCLMIFVLCEVILGLIFLPKMRLAREYASMSESEQRRAMQEGIRKSSKGPALALARAVPPRLNTHRFDARPALSSVCGNREGLGTDERSGPAQDEPQDQPVEEQSLPPPTNFSLVTSTGESSTTRSSACSEIKLSSDDDTGFLKQEESIKEEETTGDYASKLPTVDLISTGKVISSTEAVTMMSTGESPGSNAAPEITKKKQLISQAQSDNNASSRDSCVHALP